MRNVLLSSLVLLSITLGTQAAEADVIYLTPAGQAMLKAKSKGPHFGVIRKFSDKAFEWQPYAKDWKKPAQYTVIYWAHVEKIQHSLDTRVDMARMVRSVRESLLLDPKMKAQIQGAELALYPKLNATFIVQSIVENMARQEVFKQEADQGVAEKGKSNLRVLLKLWANPESYGQERIKAMAKEYRAMGVEARRALLGIVANAQRLMDKSGGKFNIMNLDPVSFGTHALKFVPELSWKLKTAEKKRMGQDEEMAKLLLDVLSSSYKTYNGQAFFREAEKQLKLLVQNSSRAKKYVMDEFSRSSDSSRKGAAALIMTKCAKNDANGNGQVGIITEATRYVLKMVRSQPKKKAKSLNHARRLLAYIMAHHPVAYGEVQRCINALEQAPESKKRLLEDELFLNALKESKGMADAYKQKLQNQNN